jgi:MYXO-CTERM domain-containing protein
VGLGIAALFLIVAALRGLKLSAAPTPAFFTLAMFGALFAARRRHARGGGDERLATGAGVVLVLFAGGLAGGLICLVGQTFALPFIDPALYRADVALGVDLEAVIRAITEVRGLPALLALAYNSSFPLIFFTALWSAWCGRFERAWEVCAIFNLCLLAATICSAIIPATGPFYFLPIPTDVRSALPLDSGTYHLSHLFALREAGHFVIDPSQLQGVATFPSFHTALALMTAAAWRDTPWIRGPMFVWQALVILSTIPIGGHYAIDLIAGAGCWALAQMVWNRSVTRDPNDYPPTKSPQAWREPDQGFAVPPFELPLPPVT